MYLLSLEASLLLGAQDTVQMEPSRRPGTGCPLGCWCPLDGAPRLILWSGSCTSESVHHICFLLQLYLPSQALRASWSSPTAPWLPVTTLAPLVGPRPSWRRQCIQMGALSRYAFLGGGEMAVQENKPPGVSS